MKAQELKNSILKHAMQGKLTPQNTNDEPVANLLFRIEKEINSSIENTSSISDFTNNSSYDIPKSWRWVRLDQLIYKIQYGYTASAQTSGNVKLLRITDIQNNQVNWNNVPYCDVPKNRISSYTLDENDIVIARTGGTIGKSHIIDKINHIAVFASYLIRIKPVKEINVNFLKRFLDSPLYWSQLRAMSAGTGQPNVNATNLKKLLIPLPPIEEQDRILKKIEALFQRVSRYDYLEQKLTVLNDNFPNNMERSILQCAMRGNLVPQDSTEGTAQQLLENLVVKKSELIRNKVIPKQLESLPISINDIYFDIPDSWEWVRLNQIGGIVSGGTPKSNEPNFWDEKGIIWITPKDMGQNKNLLISNSARKISSLGLEKSSAKLIPKGSIVYSSRAPIGYINIVKKEYTTNQGCKSVVPLVYDKYIYYALKFFTPEIIKNASGTTFKEISGSKFAQTLLPLPPEKEQYRIVERIEKLLDQTKKLSFL